MNIGIGILILICYAIAHTITDEMVFAKPRKWLFERKWMPVFIKDLMVCPTCMSFHIGWIFGIFFTPYFFLLDGFIIMGAVKLIEKISMN